MMIGANSCRRAATCLLALAIVPLLGVAQEQSEAPLTSSGPASAEAQIRYVMDKLVLNVYAEADQGSARVATIQTGDEVQELERAGNLVRVRIEDGREGWVGANYLTSTAPAIVQLRELQRQQKGTAAPLPDNRAQKAQAEKIASLEKERAALQTKVDQLLSQVSSQQATLVQQNEAAAANASMAAATPVRAIQGGVAWWILPIAVALTGVISFAGGYQTLARQLRKKFGALKIY